MEFRDYFYLFRKWAWLIALVALLSGGAALVASLNATPVYQASATLRINLSLSPGMNEYSAMLLSQRLAYTYARLLQKAPVLDGVISNLGLEMATAELREAVQVQPVRDTQLIEIIVEHPDPDIAQAIANEIPRVFAEQDQAMEASRYAQLKANLSEEMVELEDKIRQLQERMAAQKAAGAADGDVEMIVLESELEQARSTYMTLLNNYGSVQLAEAQSGNNFVVSVQAKAPNQPIRPQPRLNALIAAVVGTLLATGIAFLLEYLDDTIKTPDDVEAALGTVTLGTVARNRNYGRDQRSLVTLESPKSPISEAYRVIRTNIRFSNVDDPIQSLLVTSGNPSEGKSTTVANLGIVMAQAGQQVIIVDSDLRRPTLHKIFGLPNKQGLTTALLAESVTSDGWLQDTEVENLKVVTSGPLPPNPSELLGSRRMQQLLEELRDKADLILLDSPPVMAVADAAVAAKQMDGVVLIVDSGQTRREMAQQAYRTLEHVEASMLGVILNKVALTKGNHYYYYTQDYLDEDSGVQQWRSLGQRVRHLWHRLLRRSTA